MDPFAFQDSDLAGMRGHVFGADPTGADVFGSADDDVFGDVSAFYEGRSYPGGGLGGGFAQMSLSGQPAYGDAASDAIAAATGGSAGGGIAGSGSEAGLNLLGQGIGATATILTTLFGAKATIDQAETAKRLEQDRLRAEREAEAARVSGDAAALARAEENMRQQQAQFNALVATIQQQPPAAAATPPTAGWVMPVAIGGGVILLGGLALALTRGGGRAAYPGAPAWRRGCGCSY